MNKLASLVVGLSMMALLGACVPGAIAGAGALVSIAVPSLMPVLSEAAKVACAGQAAANEAGKLALVLGHQQAGQALATASADLGLACSW